MDTKQFLALVEKKKKEAEQKNMVSSDWGKKLEEAARRTYEGEQKKKKKHKKDKGNKKTSRRSHDTDSSSEEESSSDDEGNERHRRKSSKKRHRSRDRDRSGSRERRRRHSSDKDQKKHKRHHRSGTESFSSESDSGSGGSLERRKLKRKKDIHEHNGEASDDSVGQKLHRKSLSRTPEPAKDRKGSLPPLPRPRKSVTPEPRAVVKECVAQFSPEGGVGAACLMRTEVDAHVGILTPAIGEQEGGTLGNEKKAGVGSTSPPWRSASLSQEEVEETARRRVLESMAAKKVPKLPSGGDSSGAQQVERLPASTSQVNGADAAAGNKGQ